jgi:hypothetical protein
MKISPALRTSLVAAPLTLTVVAFWSLAQSAASQDLPPVAAAVITQTRAPLPLAGDGPGASPSNRAASLSDNRPNAREPASAAAQTLSYYTILGNALSVRTSTTTFTSSMNGCVFLAGGTDRRLTAPLLIPNGSVIKYLRIYYQDTSVGTNVTASITRFLPGSFGEDLTRVDSAGNSGYGTASSPEITHTVDLENWAYTVVVDPNAVSNTVQICGIRVAYYAPSPFTDAPLTVGGTVVKAVHFVELRQAIDTLRARFGLGVFAWTDATIVTEVTPAKAVHLTELRAALNEVYAAASLPEPIYTHPIVTGGATVITAVDVEELRAAIRAVW